jgi:hypothetical protein
VESVSVRAEDISEISLEYDTLTTEISYNIGGQWSQCLDHDYIED